MEFLPTTLGLPADRIMGGVGGEFQVSPGPSVSEPIDLGSLEMTFKRELKAVDMAPEFAAHTLDGQRISLREFRGRYVLLHFWHSAPGQRTDEITAIRKIHQKLDEDPRLAIVGLHTGGPDPKGFAAAHELDWTLCQLSDDDNRQRVFDDYGFGGCPWIFLINPYGRIVAANLLGPAIQTTVEQTLNIPGKPSGVMPPGGSNTPDPSAAADGRLWITVLADGKSVPGAVVRFRFREGRGKKSGPGSTDERGRIFVYPSADVEWVQAQKGNRYGEVEMRTLTNESRLVLQSPGDVRGTLWLGGGPWTNQVLMPNRYGFDIPATRSDSEGRFGFRDVAAGP